MSQFEQEKKEDTITKIRNETRDIATNHVDMKYPHMRRYYEHCDDKLKQLR